METEDASIARPPSSKPRVSGHEKKSAKAARKRKKRTDREADEEEYAAPPTDGVLKAKHEGTHDRSAPSGA